MCVKDRKASEQERETDRNLRSVEWIPSLPLFPSHTFHQAILRSNILFVSMDWIITIMYSLLLRQKHESAKAHLYAFSWHHPKTIFRILQGPLWLFQVKNPQISKYVFWIHYSVFIVLPINNNNTNFNLEDWASQNVIEVVPVYKLYQCVRRNSVQEDSFLQEVTIDRNEWRSCLVLYEIRRLCC